MSNPFNPQRPRDSALNAVMAGAMGTGAGKTVTFDRPPDGIISNGADVPGFGNLIKGYSAGTNGETRQISGIGRNTTLANTDSAFFTLEDDLNQLKQDGTWEVTQKLNITSIAGARFNAVIKGTKTTAQFVQWPTDVILIIQMLSDLRGAFFFRNTSGILTLLSLFDSSYTIGVQTNIGIKKDSTNYTLTIGAVSNSVDIESVQPETNNFYTTGQFVTTENVITSEHDDILRK